MALVQRRMRRPRATPRTGRQPATLYARVSPGLSLQVCAQAGLHRRFGLKTLQIARDCGDCECAPCPFEGDGTVPIFEVTVHHSFVPGLRVTYILDGYPVLPRPEERYSVESFSNPEQVTGGDLSLLLGKHPVLDAHTFTGAGIGPASDIACRENSGRARFEVFIHHDATVDAQPTSLSECARRPHSHSKHQQVCIETGTAPQNRFASLEATDRVLQMEDDTVSFVKAAYELTDLVTHHTLERFFFEGHHVDLKSACT